MNFEKWILKPDEKELPLEHMIHDGGYCGIFRTMGFVGDSLSSGEFKARDTEGWISPSPVHPTREGHRTVAEHLIPILKHLLGE